MIEGISDILIWIMDKTHFITRTWALDIILLTVLVRMALFPLNRRMSKSMKLMQKVQPEMKAIQEKFKDKPEVLQKETMELYRRYKINPLDSCWPLAVQMPIFFALFRILRDPMYYLRLPGFENATLFGLSLTIPPQLTHPYPEIALKAGVFDLYSLLHYSLFADRFLYVPTLWLLAAYIATTIIQSKQMQAQSQAASAGQPNTMAIMMPMFIFFGLFFPPGLLAYFITSNFLQMGQYWGIQREIAREEAAEKEISPKDAEVSSPSNKRALFGKKSEEPQKPNKGKSAEVNQKKKK
jgi:YidC/Oxa1 family membrane protein insertase